MGPTTHIQFTAFDGNAIVFALWGMLQDPDSSTDNARILQQHPQPPSNGREGKSRRTRERALWEVMLRWLKQLYGRWAVTLHPIF